MQVVAVVVSDVELHMHTVSVELQPDSRMAVSRHGNYIV